MDAEREACRDRFLYQPTYVAHCPSLRVFRVINNELNPSHSGFPYP
jgi:hypothetical protein